MRGRRYVVLSRRFARSGYDFSDVALSYNEEGAPLLPGNLRLECQIAKRFDAGDHLMLLGRVLRMSSREGESMVFSGGRYRRFADEM